MAEYSREYFLNQLREFWELCGKRSFWEAPVAVRDNAVKALGWVFLRTADADQCLFEAALVNYTRREGLLVAAPNTATKGTG
ncbi:hypothetical protein LCGC14_1746900 [marine sediment metagenome]|uniref:Uncharacterized protein n=1 Tax=marine sediment metagenome TaxID=412755 RepID=A0A0F9H502_9ZZZZ